jgi:hypothetical protein
MTWTISSVASGPAASFAGSPGATLDIIKTTRVNPKRVIPIESRRLRRNNFIWDNLENSVTVSLSLARNWSNFHGS